MKKIAILYFLSAIFVLQGCSKDDASPPPEPVDIAGNWALTEYTFDGSRRILEDNDVNIITFSASAWDINVLTVFSDNENNYSNVGGYNLDLTVVDENGVEFYLPSHQEVHDIGTWSRTNSFLGITIDGVLRQASISVLNDTTLKFLISSNTNETDENNQSVSVFRTEFFTYTRQSE